MNKKIFVFGIVFILLFLTGNAIATAPTYSLEYPSGGSTLYDLTVTTFYCNISDPEGNTFNWTFDTLPDVGNASANAESNGTKNCTVTGLDYSTTYTCYVNVTNATIQTNLSFSFTTRTAKLRENDELNLAEKSVVGVVGVVILIGFIYVVLKMKFEDDKTFAKLLIGVIVALALLSVIFTAL